MTRRSLLRAAAGVVGVSVPPAVCSVRAATSPMILVIVHPAVSLPTLDARQVLNVFAGVTKQWPDGAPVIPLNVPALAPTRVLFDRVVFRMSPEETAQFWIDKRVRGEGSPPRSVSDPQIMVRLVATLRGSISYIPEEYLKKTNVRVVARIHNETVVAP